jgi:peptidyl-prolyl cis-trans isomerase SurA
MNKLTSQMQKKIVDDVTITPEEVRSFFKAIPAEEIPTFGAEMEVAQIVVKPLITEEEKKRVTEKLNEIRQDVLNGSSFFSKAVLFSEDPGSSSNGGFYKMNRRTQFVKEFKDVAFTLAEGEISEPFETEFGSHIIMVEKIKGQDVELRHILISPKVSSQAIKDAKEKIDIIRNKIINKEITFADAAKSSSDEKETRNNGGVLLNPRTMEPRFELTKMDPSLYAQVSELKDGEVTIPLLDEERGGGKFYKIITINNRTEEHQADFSKDYLKIKELALRDKQIKEIAKWSEEKIKETYVKINDDYRDCEFANNWLKK